MSPMMVRFLKAYLAWAEWRIANPGECVVVPEHLDFGFNDRSGLCYHTHIFEDWDGGEDYLKGHARLITELADMFEADGLDEDYPFGMLAYDNAYEDENQYACQRRLDWIQEKLA